MGIRLNKVTRQLNVGVRTIVQFLKIHRIGEIRYDADPNTKISDEQYEAVVKHFSVDQQIRIDAEALSRQNVIKHQESPEENKTKKSKKKEKAKQKAKREAKEFEAKLSRMTPEQRIAANKERIAKFHPEPDFSRMSPRYVKELKKLDHEKSMKEKAKKIWLSIVSIPMGGLNK